MKDKGLLIPILGEPFRIKNGNSSKETTTDVNGCILFQRVIEYPQAVSKQIFFKFTTTIESRGQYMGYVNLPLAYNPWGQQVKDLRPGKETIDPAFTIIDLDNPEAYETHIKPLLTPVIARNVQLVKDTYKRTEEESEFVYNVYLRPEYRKMGAHAPVNTPLSSGEFNGDFSGCKEMSKQERLFKPLVNFLLKGKSIIPAISFLEDYRCVLKGEIKMFPLN